MWCYEPKILFPINLHCERDVGKSADRFFWAWSQPWKLDVLLSEFDPFHPITFQKSVRAAWLNNCILIQIRWRAKQTITCLSWRKLLVSILHGRIEPIEWKQEVAVLATESNFHRNEQDPASKTVSSSFDTSMEASPQKQHWALKLIWHSDQMFNYNVTWCYWAPKKCPNRLTL